MTFAGGIFHCELCNSERWTSPCGHNIEVRFLLLSGEHLCFLLLKQLGSFFFFFCSFGHCYFLVIVFLRSLRQRKNKRALSVCQMILLKSPSDILDHWFHWNKIVRTLISMIHQTWMRKWICQQSWMFTKDRLSNYLLALCFLGLKDLLTWDFV